jgi:putative solute:sodium symporter small subunit
MPPLFEQKVAMSLIHKKRVLTTVLLILWLLVSFGPSFFARDLSILVWGWPLHFWMAAQGSVLLFIGIVVIYAGLMNRWEAQEAQDSAPADSINNPAPPPSVKSV